VPEEPGDDDPEDPVVPEEPGDDDPEEPVVPEEPGGDKPGNAVVDFAETNQVEFFDPGRSNYDDTNAWNLTDGWKTSNTTLIRTDSDDPNTVVITTKPAMSSTPTDLQKTFTAEEMGDGIRFKLQCKGTGAEDSLTITLNGKPVPVDFDENGFAYISIRSEDYAPADGGDYTLTFGLDNKGSSPHIVTVSDFVIGDVLEPPVWASGNVLANDDPSSGEDIVGSFILNGTLYTIDNDSPLSESGVPYVRVEIGDDAYFIMDAEGNYTYEGREASSHFPGPLDVTYTGTTGETTLHLRDNIVKAGEDAPAGSLLHGAGGEDALVANDAGLILEGRAGNDLLYGGAGDDILIGGSGSDILYGGDGRDTFTWGIDDLLAGKDSASDIIKDFDSAQDSIDLSELLSLGLQAEDINIIKDGDDIKLWFDNPVYGGRVQEIVIENLGVGIADQTSAEQMIQDMILQQQIKMITE
jgi:Ca2+-binding RTX toxin-like protein